MEKANVMEVGVLWRDVVQKIRDKSYPEIELSHMYADAGAMQLVRWPKQFDVIVNVSEIKILFNQHNNFLPS